MRNRLKKKKPLWAKILLFFMWIIIIAALLIGLVWCACYLAFKVDLFSTVKNLISLNAPVQIETIITNPYNEEDLTNINTKIDNITSNLSNETFTFYDKELGAYLNNKVQSNNGIDVNIAGKKLNSKDISLTVHEIIITSSNNINKYADFSVLISLNLNSLKKDLNSFPVSLIKGLIPETIYINASCEILKDAEQQYVISGNEFRFNNLSLNQSKDIINTINKFTKIGTSDNFAKKLTNNFIEEIIGNEKGLYYAIASNCSPGKQANFAFDTNGTVTYSITASKYTINIISNYDNAGVFTGNDTSFEYGDNPTISVTPNLGYSFLGWYSDSAMNTSISSATSYSKNNITSNLTIYAKFELIQHTITYENAKTTLASTIFDVLTPQITLGNPSVNGYKFLGWFTEQNSGIQITTITPNNESEFKDYTLYGHWNLITYSITYNLGNGILSSSNPTTYTIETETFTLNNPTREDEGEFTGWTINNSLEVINPLSIEKGTYGNLEITAHYSNDTLNIQLYVDTNSYPTYTFSMPYNTNLTVDVINEQFDPFELNMGGYNVKTWYLNYEQTNPYTPLNLKTDLSLYGTWTYFTNTIFFAPYYNEFYNAETVTKTLSIDSEEKFTAWLDYVYFYNVTTAVTLNITYDNFMPENINVYIQEYYHSSPFQSVASLSCTTNGQKIYIYISDDSTKLVQFEGTMQAPSSLADLEPQLDYAFKQEEKNIRDNTCSFNIDNVKKTIKNVTTSEQLVRVLEQGYRPLCVINSNAENIYNTAKNILRKICTDNMTDTEKLKSIYEWLILNVQYDQRAPKLQNKLITQSLSIETLNELETQWNNNSSLKNSFSTFDKYLEYILEKPSYALRFYDAWFADGVFNNGIAVCEGIAKAFIILAKIENIATVMVTDEDHAWNKVLIDGKWYGIDATHGNARFLDNGIVYEYIDFSQFMFTDTWKSELKTSTGFYSDEEYTANTPYDYFSNTQIETGTNNIILFIENETNLTTLLNYARSQISSMSTTKFTIQVSTNLDNFTSLLAGTGISYIPFSKDSINHNVYTLIFSK